MKKIAFVCGNISKRAGIERAVINLANILVHYSEITIVSASSTHSNVAPYNLDQRVNIIHGNIATPQSLFGVIAYSFKIIHLLKRITQQEKIDILVGTMCYINVSILFVPRASRFAWEHFTATFIRPVTRILRSIFYRFADAVVCLTKADAKHYKMNNVHVIPNCNSLEIGKDDYNRSSKTIVALGRLSSEKGFDMLLQTAVSIRAKHPDWHIDIYGDGRERENLQTQILQLEIDDFVTIYEPVSDVKEILKSSSIYVMTSHYEGLAMVLLEAQCCGLPLVSFDCPNGPGEIISDGVNGYLVPPGDVEMLADKINYLIENPEKRVEMSVNSRKNAENYTPEKIAQKWIDLFESLEGK